MDVLVDQKRQVQNKSGSYQKPIKAAEFKQINSSRKDLERWGKIKYCTLRLLPIIFLSMTMFEHEISLEKQKI